LAPARHDELASLAPPIRARLDAANAARETGLAAARRTIQSSSQSIRATHRHEWDQASQLADAASQSLREAQGALKPFPQLAASGPLHDAAKEYVERGQCYFSIECEDPFLEFYVEHLGADSVIFASDYPHWDADFPGTVEEMRTTASKLGDEVTAKVLGGNALRLYGLT
jgi:hypothetical protein